VSANAVRRRRPTWPVAGFLFGPWCAQVVLLSVLSVLAWLLFVIVSAQSTGAPAQAKAAMWWCMPGMGIPGSQAVSATERIGSSLPMLLLMCAAMTLPGVLPAAQHVATNTLRRRRSATVGVFMAMYLLVWLAAMAALELLLIPLGGAPGDTMFSVALASAALYELTPMKRWALNRCHRSWPLAPTGSRNVTATARFAWINVSGCVASCGPSMIAMLAAPVARPLVMFSLAVTMTYERLARRPRRERQRIASGYMGIAALFAILAF
jgi:hypothetical protein